MHHLIQETVLCTMLPHSLDCARVLHIVRSPNQENSVGHGQCKEQKPSLKQSKEFHLISRYFVQEAGELSLPLEIHAG